MTLNLKRLFLASFALATVLVMALPAQAQTSIQRVISPGGIEAWLVEERGLPIIGLEVSWAGGSASDPQGKGGLAYLLSATLDEGAGALDSAGFRRALTDKAISISFEAGRDDFSGSMKTLTENRDAAFELLRLALTVPRFDPEPVERMKRDILTAIVRDAQNASSVAGRVWLKAALGDVPYARPRKGTAETVAALIPGDLKDFHRRLISREGMKVSVVGDIDAKTLARLLDETFGELPRQSGIPADGAQVPIAGASFAGVTMNTPQTVIRFGFKGLLRHDPDFVPAFVLNHILGGGSFSSRLYEEVREKRGLAYGVSTSLRPYERAALWVGGTATRAERAAETLEVIRAELDRMAKDGPTQTELDDAKTYLTGAYPLRFDTNSKIAGQLAGIQRQDLGIDYIEKRNGLVEAVTLDDLKRVAAQLIKTDSLIVVAVGQEASIAALKPES
ncbi:Peptidase, M16 family [hydrothermal vent metagenome]|uniref:Peptidase, M16 family n=1 Tax=hydrothermal vent metagenome TaxID=652676 RepID=A0A3B0TX61_9ZZZZ